MSRTADRAAEWIYQGVWGVLASWFKVPKDPPALPASSGETIRAFKPARQFLAYRKFYFWLGLTFIDLVLTVAYIILVASFPLVGVILFPVYFVIAVVPDILAYIAIHLAYDTTWYVLGDRSMRIRRGIWLIHETTITYENIQNIAVNQGPLERYFGIATLTVQTAGGGSGGGKHKSRGDRSGTLGAHIGILEGITDAHALRDQLSKRVELSRSAGLGDEHHTHDAHAPSRGAELGPDHLALLAEIRDLLRTPSRHA